MRLVATLAVLLALGVRAPITAANPTIAADTRPFPAEPGALALAKSLVGTSCAHAFRSTGITIPGFVRPPGFEPIIVRDGYIAGARRGPSRFAFLLTVPNGDIARCRVADVVVLPNRARADAWLSCHSDDGTSTGIGMRRIAPADLVAYWSVDIRHGRHLVRQPVHAAGVDSFTCQQPETGE